MKNPLVSVVMGSQSDLEVVREAIEVLKGLSIKFEVKVLSAHRTPKELAAYVEGCSKRGVKILIAAAGGAAALAGVIAAHTTLPVIGIPIETRSLKGLDSLLSTVQMPAGVAVASMAIGKAGAKNAALFAAAILALGDRRIARDLADLRRQSRLKIRKIKIKI
ncbi:MAG: 5-(carboxyamino)imidazole ribonucleotide mutase [Candidatus Omnitrophota bacterium]